MKIISLRLVGYKRLLLNNIRVFDYNPASNYQIIIGRNGSGKSSVLQELTPLPANSSDFETNGYKTIKLEHRGDLYVLTSFKEPGKHSFLINDNELNPGGTGKVQKELVRQHFNITQEIHNLMIGEEKFTNMSPSRRREWITKISDYDLTYALGIFKQLTSRGRDVLGTLRTQRERLYKEMDKLLTEEDYSSLEEQASAIKEELSLLLSSKDNQVDNNFNYKLKIETNLEKITNISNRLKERLLKRPTDIKSTNYQEFTEELLEKRVELKNENELLIRDSEQLSELQKLFENDCTLSPEELAEKKEQIVILNKQLSELEDQATTLPYQIEDSHNCWLDAKSIIGPMKERLLEVPDNSDSKYTQETLKQAKIKNEKLEAELDHEEGRLKRLQHHISVIREAKTNECPKCSYSWKDGVTEGQLEKMSEEAELTGKKVQQLKSDIDKLIIFKEEADEWLRSLRIVREMIDSYPRLKPLWNTFTKDQQILINTKPLLGEIADWERSLNVWMEIDSVKDKLGHLQVLIGESEKTKGTQHLLKQKEQLECSVENSTQNIYRLQNQLKSWTLFKQRCEECYEGVREIINLTEEIMVTREQHVKVIRNQHIDGVISEHHSNLATTEKQLNDNRTLKGIVSNIESGLQQYEMDHQAYKLLSDALSPTEGLIADQLRAFIGCFTDQINDVINQIWTYDLFVLPCGMESDDLDYKFPVQVRTPSNTTPDVSKTSEGQQEIINLAFKLIVILYMDFSNYPLFLDEVGRAMDEQHRVNLVNYIKLIIDARRHSTVFYISHFASSYGAMSGAEVLVMDGSNITVPANHNQHVIME